MLLEHKQLLKSDFGFYPDFELNPPSTRWDPTRNMTVTGRPTKVFGVDFEYAGELKKGYLWTRTMGLIKGIVEKAYDREFITCLVGHYPDGNTNISYHKDVMGTSGEGLIVNLSFGSPRIFNVKWDGCEKVDSYIMTNGQVLTFDYEANQLMQHAVPAVKGLSGERYSLTFRTHTHL